jgi:hypothetical protein
MTLAEVPKGTKPTIGRKVQAALALDEFSLTYRVEMRPDEALAFAANCGDYNEATEARLARLVKRLDRAIPPMWFDSPADFPNPNNGKPHHVYHVGREGSRVLYLEIRLGYLESFRPPVGSEWRTLPTLATFERLFGDFGQEARADEFSVERDAHSWTFRFWWD